MSSKATIALVTLVTTTTGCYSTWDIAPRSLVRLDGFREGQTRQLEAEGPGRDEVPFTSGTELRLRDVSGAEGTAHLRAADVRGPMLIAVERDGLAPFSVDLTRLAAVRAKNFSPGKTAGLAVGLGLGVPAAAFGIFVAVLASSGGFGSGRPLRVSGQASPVRARLRLDRAARGARPSRAPSMDDVTRARLLAHWASEASAECASVPAFLALARDLELASAPSGLVAHARRAAREEAAHTRLCSALASEHAGAAVVARTPPTPPNRDADSPSLLERLALEAFWDGCVAEGLAATLARRSAPLANDEATGRALRTIARDEHGHAELARGVVAHCLSAGGRPIRAALVESFERRRTDEEARVGAVDGGGAGEPCVDEDLTRMYGLVGPGVSRAARAEAWEKSALDHAVITTR